MAQTNVSHVCKISNKMPEVQIIKQEKSFSYIVPGKNDGFLSQAKLLLLNSVAVRLTTEAHIVLLYFFAYL